MTDRERYLFDLQGFLHIPKLLTADEAARLLQATRELEARALAIRDRSPTFRAVWGQTYWRDPDHGVMCYGEQARGKTLMLEDFWLYPEAFDCLIGHPGTLAYIRRLVPGAITINNSEIRIRYAGNHTGMHMGYPHGHTAKYAYRVIGSDIHCMMVRMVYFLHDVTTEQGPMCFVPGSHKGAFEIQHTGDPANEPGVVGLPVRAGDAVIFTEACRHGGLTNQLDAPRYTLHVGYGPAFMRSQNIGTMDEPQNVTPALLARLKPEQAALLTLPVRRPLAPGN